MNFHFWLCVVTYIIKEIKNMSLSLKQKISTFIDMHRQWLVIIFIKIPLVIWIRAFVGNLIQILTFSHLN